MSRRSVSKEEAQKRLNDAGRKIKILDYECMRGRATLNVNAGMLLQQERIA